MRIQSDKEAPGTMKRVSDIHREVEMPKKKRIAPNTMLSTVRHNGDTYEKGTVVSDPILQEKFRAQGLIS